MNLTPTTKMKYNAPLSNHKKFILKSSILILREAIKLIKRDRGRWHSLGPTATNGRNAASEGSDEDISAWLP